MEKFSNQYYSGCKRPYLNYTVLAGAGQFRDARGGHCLKGILSVPDEN